MAHMPPPLVERKVPAALPNGVRQLRHQHLPCGVGGQFQVHLAGGAGGEGGVRYTMPRHGLHERELGSQTGPAPDGQSSRAYGHRRGTGEDG